MDLKHNLVGRFEIPGMDMDGGPCGIEQRGG